MITLFTAYLDSNSINFNPFWLYFLTVFMDLFIMECIENIVKKITK